MEKWSDKKIMKLQYASFLLPLHSGSAEQDELNRFLRGHRVVQTRKEMAVTDGGYAMVSVVQFSWYHHATDWHVR